MDPDIRRRLNAIGLMAEHDRLVYFLASLVEHAIELYRNEFISESYPLVQRCAEIFVADAADRGAFAWFGIRDRADLVSIPWLIYPGAGLGRIGVTVHEMAQVIMRGGTRREWVRAGDLEFTGAAR